MSDSSVIEHRSWKECRVETDGTMRKLDGMAIVFNSLSQDLGGFREIIDPSAVDRALNEAADIRALYDHDSSKVLGRTRAGTLMLRKQSNGLRAIIEPDTEISYVKDLMRSVGRGDVSGMSFGFRTLSDEWDFEQTIPIRTVTDMTISEVSIVSFPAYLSTDVSVAVRSMQAFTATNPKRSKAYFDAKLRMLR